MSENPREDKETASESRREALKKFGRYAAVTTPAMLMLLDSNRQEAMAYNKYETSKPVSKPRKKWQRKKYSWWQRWQRWQRRYY